MQGRDMIVACVILPAFLMSQAEYNSIEVPQLKNFKVITEKTSSSKTKKAREFFENFEESEVSWKVCAITAAVAIFLILVIIAIILATAIEE